jgi:hypothetical protein
MKCRLEQKRYGSLFGLLVIGGALLTSMLLLQASNVSYAADMPAAEQSPSKFSDEAKPRAKHKGKNVHKKRAAPTPSVPDEPYTNTTIPHHIH